MKRINHKEVGFLLRRMVLLTALAAGIVYWQRPVASAGFAEKGLSPGEFHAARQILWVHADSLQSLIRSIQLKEPGVFSIDADDSEWTVTVQDKKAFERIFLDGEPLANWDTGKHPSIEKLNGNAGFKLIAKRIHDQAYVRVPAEIMQSLLIAN